MKVLEALNIFLRLVQTLINSITSDTTKRLRDFMVKLFTAAASLPGKKNFSQLARYSDLSERTFRNRFQQGGFDWEGLNHNIMERRSAPGDEFVVAFDPAYISKSGKSTYGVGKYWSGVEKRSKDGLEIMALAAIDIDTKSCTMLEAVQTPPVKELKDGHGMTMLDWYLKLLLARKDTISQITDTVVGDAFFSRKKFIDGIVGAGLKFVGRLLPKQRLRYIAVEQDREAATHKRGRKFRYAGKVDPDNLDLSRVHPCHVKDADRAYWLIANCVAMDRDIKIVVAHNIKMGTVMYFSTDTDMEAQKIVKIYRMRFQIEFGIRDCKQFAGLNDSQARSRQKLDFSFNLSFALHNIIALESETYFCSISVGKMKRLLENAFLFNIIRRKFGGRPNLRLIKNLEDFILNLTGIRA